MLIEVKQILFRDHGWVVISIRDGSPKKLVPSPYVVWQCPFDTFTSLPPLTKERCSLLALCDDDTVVAGIGRKVTHGLYWLTPTPALLAEYSEEIKCKKNATQRQEPAPGVDTDRIVISSHSAD